MNYLVHVQSGIELTEHLNREVLEGEKIMLLKVWYLWQNLGIGLLPYAQVASAIALSTYDVHDILVSADLQE